MARVSTKVMPVARRSHTWLREHEPRSYLGARITSRLNGVLQKGECFDQFHAHIFDCRNDRYRNAGAEKTIFDCRCAGFFFKETLHLLEHVTLHQQLPRSERYDRKIWINISRFKLTMNWFSVPVRTVRHFRQPFIKSLTRWTGPPFARHHEATASAVSLGTVHCPRLCARSYRSNASPAEHIRVRRLFAWNVTWPKHPFDGALRLGQPALGGATGHKIRGLICLLKGRCARCGTLLYFDGPCFNIIAQLALKHLQLGKLAKPWHGTLKCHVNAAFAAERSNLGIYTEESHVCIFIMMGKTSRCFQRKLQRINYDSSFEVNVCLIKSSARQPIVHGVCCSEPACA
jgi:hypothetical protein